MTHVLILGGDGYLGWPTAMYLSNLGYDVTVVDNYLRRDTMKQYNLNMLFETPNLVQRARLWYELTGKEIKVVIADLANAETMNSLFEHGRDYDFQVNKSKFKIPSTVIHYAEQPSAPFSMMGAGEADLTLTNNLRVTNNLIWSVKNYSPETHIVKLGTMGEYGTPNIDIEEGWIDISHKGRSDRFLFPRQASSLYHTTKIMDTDLLWFAVRTWDLTVTDLMQGPVYGIDTDETLYDIKLRPSFNYDEVFGTVINRFITQAVCDYPLTVYGAGGQTRGYLNIRDTMQCIKAAIEHPPKLGSFNIYNQIMETFSVLELAELTKISAKKIGIDVNIRHIENPRKELEEHYYNPSYQGLKELGVKPHLLNEETMAEMMKIVLNYKSEIDKGIIFSGVKW